jgi:CRISPR-associated protein Cas2
VARKNRYSGILQPLQVGKGKPESSLLLIYDIEDDRLRTRAADICLDYGLERIQFSAFFGKLNRNRRQELGLKLRNEIGNQPARIRMIPICEEDLKEVWMLDQYRPKTLGTAVDGEVVEIRPELPRELPKLRILRQEE